MYLPATELQMYRGQLCCQYCIMDLKDEVRRVEEAGRKAESWHKERELGERYEEERCERCGRALTMAFFYNDKRLCGSCVEEEKKKWGGVGGERPPMVALRVREDRPSILSSIVQGIGNRIREAWREKENPEKKEERKEKRKARKDGKGEKTPKAKKEEPTPMTEGLMRRGAFKDVLDQYKDIPLVEESKKEGKIKKKKDRKGKK